MKCRLLLAAVAALQPAVFAMPVESGVPDTWQPFLLEAEQIARKIAEKLEEIGVLPQTVRLISEETVHDLTKDKVGITHGLALAEAIADVGKGTFRTMFGYNPAKVVTAVSIVETEMGRALGNMADDSPAIHVAVAAATAGEPKENLVALVGSVIGETKEFTRRSTSDSEVASRLANLCSTEKCKVAVAFVYQFGYKRSIRFLTPCISLVHELSSIDVPVRLIVDDYGTTIHKLPPSAGAEEVAEAILAVTEELKRKGLLHSEAADAVVSRIQYALETEQSIDDQD